MYVNLTYNWSNVIDIAVDNNAWLSVRDTSNQCNPDYPTTVVRFHEDLVTTCVLQWVYTSVKVNDLLGYAPYRRVPLAEILNDCDGVRRRAFDVLTPSPQLNYVGIFGDSNPLNISEWVQVINDTSPGSDGDQVMN